MSPDVSFSSLADWPAVLSIKQTRDRKRLDNLEEKSKQGLSAGINTVLVHMMSFYSAKQ